jgi:hypothetical protein
MRFFLSLVLLLLSLPAYPLDPTTQEKDLYAGLFSWALKLSGYMRPVLAPTVEFVPQQYFIEHACHGRQCRVWGWYPNTGRGVVYVHAAVRALIDDGSDPKSLLAASIIVHEFTHYLQAANRGFAQYECEESIELEREAYAVQNAYVISYGRYMQVGVSMHNAGCAGSASDSPVDSLDDISTK